MSQVTIPLPPEADEESLFESIIAKSYSNFAALVMKSYSARFVEPSKVTEMPASEEELVLPTKRRKPRL